MGSRIRSVSAAVRTARSGSGLISPSWRTRGDEPTDMWRSEAFMDTRIRRSSSISAVGPPAVGREETGAAAGAAAAAAGAEAARPGKRTTPWHFGHFKPNGLSGARASSMATGVWHCGQLACTWSSLRDLDDARDPLFLDEVAPAVVLQGQEHLRAVEAIQHPAE